MPRKFLALKYLLLILDTILFQNFNDLQKILEIKKNFALAKEQQQNPKSS